MPKWHKKRFSACKQKCNHEEMEQKSGVASRLCHIPMGGYTHKFSFVHASLLQLQTLPRSIKETLTESLTGTDTFPFTI